MPSGPKKRRAAKRKKELETSLASRDATISRDVIDNKELETILVSRDAIISQDVIDKKELETILVSKDATISQDVIDNTSCINIDANLGDYPVVSTNNTVDSPEPEDKLVKDDIKAISDEAELTFSLNQNELNVLPLVDPKTADHLHSLIVSDLKDKKECLALIQDNSSESFPDENEPFFASLQDNSLEENYKDEKLVVCCDNPTNDFASDGEKCLKEFECGSVANQDALINFSKELSEEIVGHLDDASADIVHGLGAKENYEFNFLQANDDTPPVLESGGATLSPVNPDQARDTYEADLQVNEALLASDNTKSLSASQQINPNVGVLTHKEIAVEEKNVGHDRKILNTNAEEIEGLKKTIEEVLIATNKLRELLLEVLDECA